MKQVPSRIEALKAAVESRSWAMVEVAVESLEKSLSVAFRALVGTSETQAGEGNPASVFWRDHHKDMATSAEYRAAFEREVEVLHDKGLIDYYNITRDSQPVVPHKSNVRCPHWNNFYGRCLLDQGHEPIDNGVGVRYLHKYAMKGSHGDLDVMEAVPVEGGAKGSAKGHARSYRECATCNLDSVDQEKDSQVQEDVPHSPPPVPTLPHSPNQLAYPCCVHCKPLDHLHDGHSAACTRCDRTSFIEKVAGLEPGTREKIFSDQSGEHCSCCQVGCLVKHQINCARCDEDEVVQAIQCDGCEHCSHQDGNHFSCLQCDVKSPTSPPLLDEIDATTPWEKMTVTHVEKAQDPDKMAAAIEQDRRDAAIVREKIKKLCHCGTCTIYRKSGYTGNVH